MLKISALPSPLRMEGSTVTRIPCNYDTVVSKGELETFLLQPGDTLVVP